MAVVAESPYDTSQAAMDLVYTVRRCPDLRVVLAHARGALPMISGRWGGGGRDRPVPDHRGGRAWRPAEQPVLLLPLYLIAQTIGLLDTVYLLVTCRSRCG